MPIVRRITGGGVVEHGDDLTFSIVLSKNEMPVFGNAQSSYQLINNIIISVIKGVSQDKKIELYPTHSIPHAQERKSYFCFQKPTKYDLMLNGIKIGGNAQRRAEGKLLHQGSLRLVMDDFQRSQFIKGFYNRLISFLENTGKQ